MKPPWLMQESCYLEIEKAVVMAVEIAASAEIHLCEPRRNCFVSRSSFFPVAPCVLQSPKARADRRNVFPFTGCTRSGQPCEIRPGCRRKSKSSLIHQVPLTDQLSISYCSTRTSSMDRPRFPRLFRSYIVMKKLYSMTLSRSEFTRSSMDIG